MWLKSHEHELCPLFPSPLLSGGNDTLMPLVDAIEDADGDDNGLGQTAKLIKLVKYVHLKGVIVHRPVVSASSCADRILLARNVLVRWLARNFRCAQPIQVLYIH